MSYASEQNENKTLKNMNNVEGELITRRLEIKCKKCPVYTKLDVGDSVDIVYFYVCDSGITCVKCGGKEFIASSLRGRSA
jgi:hypothetical protein